MKIRHWTGFLAVAALAAAGANFPLGTYAFTDGDDGETVLVSDEYLDEIAAMMKRKGKTEYDPFADWDGDGASNYAEYKSGTNPFALAAGRAALVTDAARLTLTGTASVETMNTTGDVAADSLTISSTGTLAGRNVQLDTIRVDSLDLRSGSGLRLFPNDLDTNANYDFVSGRLRHRTRLPGLLEKRELVCGHARFTLLLLPFRQSARVLRAGGGGILHEPRGLRRVGGRGRA